MVLSPPRFSFPSPGLTRGSTSDLWCVVPGLSNLKAPVWVSPSCLPKWEMKHHGGSLKAAAAGPSPLLPVLTHPLPQKMPLCEPLPTSCILLPAREAKTSKGTNSGPAPASRAGRSVVGACGGFTHRAEAWREYGLGAAYRANAPVCEQRDNIEMY